MLRFVFVVIAWLVAWLWSDWRNWRHYNASILFVIAGDLLYNVLTSERPMWLLNTRVANHTINDLVLTLGFSPAAILVYLSHFPYSSGYWKRLFAVMVGTTCFSVVEYIELKVGNIHYYNGWSFTWSVIFNIILFTSVALHQKKPLLTYGLSVIIVITFLSIFRVPITQLR